MNGAPAPEQVTNSIFEKVSFGRCERLKDDVGLFVQTKEISELKMADDLPEIDISKIGKTKVKQKQPWLMKGACSRYDAVRLSRWEEAPRGGSVRQHRRSR